MRKSTKGSTAAHSVAVNKILAMLYAAFGQNVFAMKQQSGVFQRLNTSHKSNWAADKSVHGIVRVGVPGMADIGGWIVCPRPPMVIDGPERNWPMPFQIEVKTGSATTQAHQAEWQHACELWGVPHYLFHSSGIWCQADKDALNALITEIADNAGYEVQR